jgi:hypothetical protein
MRLLLFLIGFAGSLVAQSTETCRFHPEWCGTTGTVTTPPYSITGPTRERVVDIARAPISASEDSMGRALKIAKLFVENGLIPKDDVLGFIALVEKIAEILK